MTRWFFPIGIALLLAAVALSHWEHAGPPPDGGSAPATRPSPAVEAPPQAIVGF